MTKSTTKKGPASVEFRNVTKRYGTVAAVSDVSFAIEPGTLVTLLGPSGCGKTTTLRLIAGLEIATEGQIRIAGEDVTNLSAADRDVANPKQVGSTAYLALARTGVSIVPSV